MGNASRGTPRHDPTAVRSILLDAISISDELKRVALNPEFPYKLAPVEEVLEFHPALRSPS
jgi:hypothetical protein